MAIDFVHFQYTDLAIHTWTDNFNMKDLLCATQAYMVTPAKFEILDIRRLNLESISSTDLFNLAENLRSAYQSDQHIPGKTAIVYRADDPPLDSSSQGLFHSFSIWAREHQLPRDFALFSSMAGAIAWLGSRKIQNEHTESLTTENHGSDSDQILSA